MEERTRRIGENEALYRSINEKIEGLNTSFGMVTESISVICECGSLPCNEQIELDLPTYESVRADPTLFVVVPGHEIADVESIVRKADGYHIIRKNPGEPARIARDTDPRS